MTKRVAIYLRVSTDGQTTENQRLELEDVVQRSGREIVGVYRRPWHQRFYGMTMRSVTVYLPLRRTASAGRKPLPRTS